MKRNPFKSGKGKGIAGAIITIVILIFAAANVRVKSVDNYNRDMQTKGNASIVAYETLKDTKNNDKKEETKQQGSETSGEFNTYSSESTQKADEVKEDKNTDNDNKGGGETKQGEEPEEEQKDISQPEEEENTKEEVQEKEYAICTFSIRCDSITAIKDTITNPALRDNIPDDGTIFSNTTFKVEKGTSVLTLLLSIAANNNIQIVNSNGYIRSLGNIAEFDGGSRSGWMYAVNGVYPNVGCGYYTIKDGDVIEWRYTCDYQNE